MFLLSNVDKYYNFLKIILIENTLITVCLPGWISTVLLLVPKPWSADDSAKVKEDLRRIRLNTLSLSRS